MYRRTSFRLCVLVALVACTTIVDCEKSDVSSYETVHNSNAAILNRLGLVPLRIPDGHHKKRLAGPEPSDAGDIGSPVSSQTRIHQPYSRRHGHRDSHVYIVKLPPSQPYYTLTKPHKTTSPEHEAHDKIATKTTRTASTGDSNPQVGFHNNGKPAKIYHWNLPIVKKITEKKRLHSQLRMEQMRKKLENEMNDRQKSKSGHKKHQRAGDKKETILFDTNKRPVMASAAEKKTSANEFNDKRYHHHSTSVNSLTSDEKPMKHTRNNDKRLNYPRAPEELRRPGRPAAIGGKPLPNDDTTNKMYRLEDSSVYNLNPVNNEPQTNNDRLAVWRLSNELHASKNTPNSLKPKKHRKKAAMSYYAPIISRINKMDASATSIQKNFPGNGKPKAFYVMEKSRQPIYYHPLLP